MADNEWVTVRRRRNAKPSYQKKLKEVSLASASLPIHVLREEDEEEREKRLKLRAKKKRNAENKKAAKALGEEWVEWRQVYSGRPNKEELTSGCHSQEDPSGTNKEEVFFLIQLWLSILAFFKNLLGLSGKSSSSTSKKKSTPKVAPPARTPPAQTKEAPSQPAAPKTVTAQTKPATKAGIDTAAKSSGATATAAGAAKSSLAAAGAAKELPSTQAKAAAADVDTKPEPSPVPPPPAPKPVPKAKPPPACDKDGPRGEFLYSEVEEAHADVVAAVAISGDVVLTGGYDGALKVWRWKDKTQPVWERSLIGHEGRVEAVALNTSESKAVSGGRDSCIKVWDVSNTDSSCATASYYCYESIRSMQVDWQGGCAVIGTKNGALSSWSLEKGKKTQVLKGHMGEVTCIKFADTVRGAAGLMYSGSLDQTVRVWDVREGITHSCSATIEGMCGRVCAIDISDNVLFVSDYSSSVKLFDIWTYAPLPEDQHHLANVPFPFHAKDSCPLFDIRTYAPLPGDQHHLANVPFHAGDLCPVAALHHDTAGQVLLSSCIAWWTDDRDALAEAPEDEEDPASVLNVHATGGSAPEYVYSVRLGEGIVTSMGAAGDRIVFGRSNGALSTLQLARGSGKRALREGTSMATKFSVDLVEFNDDEDDEDEE
eukprot:gene7791-982_t